MVKIVFLHPNMGIGGAERLVIDAALAFKSKGHEVTFYTNYFDPDHCFDEVKQDILPIKVVGNWFPRSIFGRFKAACAGIRMIIAALYLALFVIPVQKPKLVICDLVPHCIPFLKLASGQFKVVLYCHFPDKLLIPKSGILKNLYRGPIDWLEEISTNCADKVLVNSNFTAEVYRKTFCKITKAPIVCYPSINVDFFRNVVPLSSLKNFYISPEKFVFLSINRYARQKNLTLALTAFEHLRKFLNESSWSNVHIIMAGGFDPTNEENIEHYTELRNLSSTLKIEDKVTFLKSPSDADKVTLLYHCSALLYTPVNEHFGITPLEAMYFKKPVIAVNSGGPKESIVNEGTGLLREANRESFTEAMCTLVNNPKLGKRMGEAGRKRLEKNFSFQAFSGQINELIDSA